jgi:hypothetical protein
MKLIEAESAKIAFCKNCLEKEKCEERETVCSDYANFADTLDSMPTIDAEPVKHGTWLPYKITSSVICSDCRRVFSDETPHCPNCGARMDGDST